MQRLLGVLTIASVALLVVAGATAGTAPGTVALKISTLNAIGRSCGYG